MVSGIGKSFSLIYTGGTGDLKEAGKTDGLDRV